MRTLVQRFPLERADRLGRTRPRRTSARRAFLRCWRAYGQRIVQLMLAGHRAGARRLTITVSTRLVRKRRNALSGRDDVIEMTLRLRADDLAADEILLAHYEQLGRCDLLAQDPPRKP